MQFGAFRAVLYAICLTACVAVFFRAQLQSGFARLLSGRGDGFIEISLLEHWRNVVAGRAAWADTFAFHPYAGTLAFNDGYLLYGLPYAALRALGADPFLGSELVNVAMRAVAFAAFQVFLRRALGLRWWLSLAGAATFTLSCTMAMRANHEQLLTVALAPLLGWLLATAARALAANAPRRLALAMLSAGLLMAAWLLTAYYMAWFTLYFLGAMTVLALATERRAILAGARAMPRRAWLGLGAAALNSAAALAPFLGLYVPQAAATGGQPYTSARFYTIAPLDALEVGRGNWLYAQADRLLDDWLRPGFPAYSEHTTGFTWGVLAVFLVACAAFWRARRTLHGRLPWLLAAASVLTWLSALHLPGHTPWYGVYHLVPGAKGLRVVVRYQLFLAAPVIAVAFAYLDRQAARRPALVAGAALWLVAEQITGGAPIALDRPGELAQLRAIPRPPASCRSFFVSHRRPEPIGPPEMNVLYNGNTEAMVLAEWFALPTLNGFSTFMPPDWNFADTESADYPDRVFAYARAHGLTDVCALDIPRARWDVMPFAADGGQRVAPDTP